jgi:hypothetical protein
MIPAKNQRAQEVIKIHTGMRNAYKRHTIGRYVNKTAASHLRRQRIFLKAASICSRSWIKDIISTWQEDNYPASVAGNTGELYSPGVAGNRLN